MKIRVKILESGTQGREINPLPDRLRVPEGFPGSGAIDLRSSSDKKEWETVEASLRTFEISNIDSLFIDGNFIRDKQGAWAELVPGTIHDATLMENGKIKIID